MQYQPARIFRLNGSKAKRKEKTKPYSISHSYGAKKCDVVAAVERMMMKTGPL